MPDPSKTLATPTSGTRDKSRSLAELLGDRLPSSEAAGGVRITEVSADSRRIKPGALFLALVGTKVDGHAYVSDAIARGAAAVVVQDDAGVAMDGPVPVIRVDNTRQALAEVAARWYGRPADRLSLIGITGTVGKTSVLTMLEAILNDACAPIGIIGSLGLQIGGEVLQDTGFTSPDPLHLHAALDRIVRQGADMAAMEVTSHALVQDRMHGLRFDLGILTNLVPLEHSDYHRSFRDYVEAKRRFLHLLRDGAPLIYNADDLTARQVARDERLYPVGCGAAQRATVRIEDCATGAEGTRLRLRIRRPMPRLAGGEVAPTTVPLRLRLLGRSNVSNVALAATAALCIGVDPRHIEAALADVAPPKRRMEIIHRSHFTILDDTVGHPDSVSAAFEVAQALEPRRIHVVYAVRGSRGVRINRQIAESFSVWLEQLRVETLVVTRSEDAADERNRVEDREYSAFLAPLRRHGVAIVERDRLDDAVRVALDSAVAGDLVMLLGAQGMDQGQEVARQWLDQHGQAAAAQ